MLKAQDGTPVIEVTGWKAAQSGYASPHLGVTGAYGKQYSGHFDMGTMIALDGKEHLERRRLIGRLLDNADWFKDKVLVPAVERNIKEALASPDPDGFSRIDLVPFNMRVSQQMAAAMVGLDRALTTDGVIELLSLVTSLGKSQAKLELIFDYDVDSVLPRALAARQAIFDKFYSPALEIRRDIVDRFMRGELAETDLPFDMITLLLLHGNEAGVDEETAFREALLMLTAGTLTTALSTTWAIHELLSWFSKHPEDLPLRNDQQFLLRAFTESLRLHPGLGGNLRRATANVVLDGKVEVHHDEFAMLYKAAANRDSEVFGEDANEFNPRRILPAGVHEYGLAFGNGRHKCFGMPLVIGTKSTDGIAPRLLTRLFAAGIRTDPAQTPTKFGEDHRGYDQWSSYPMMLRGDLVTSASPQ
jgi:cytochrome P450